MIITGPPTHSGKRWGQNSNDRGRLSSSVTLHGGHAGGGQAMTSLFLQSNYRSTDARGPVVLRPVGATPCYIIVNLILKQKLSA